MALALEPDVVDHALDAELRLVSRWTLGALHNQLKLAWMPVDFIASGRAKPSLGAEYSPLYTSLLEALPGLEPDRHALLTAYRPAPPWPYRLGTADVHGRLRFARCFGDPSDERTAASRDFMLGIGQITSEADALLRGMPRAGGAKPDIIPPVTPPARTSSPPPEPCVDALPVAEPSEPHAAVVAGPSVAATPTAAITEAPVRVLERDGVQIAARPLLFTPVAQVQGLLADLSKKKTPAAIMALALERLMVWLQGKEVRIPADWRQRPSWEAGTDGAARQVWFESADSHVAVRFDEPCGQVPGRHWRVELAMVENEGRVHIGTKVSAMVQQGVATDVRPTVPRWVRDLAADLAFIVDGQVLTDRPTDVANGSQLQRLVDLITRPRSCAVVVCVTPHARSREGAMAAVLAQRVAGAAHVVTLHAHLLPALATRLGSAGRIPRNGVRFYGRAFDGALAAVRCPLLADHVWPRNAGVEILAEACAAETVAISDPDDLPSFAQIRQFVARRRRQLESERAAGASRRVEDELQAAQVAQAVLEEDLKAAEQLAEELQGQLIAKADEVRARDAKIWFLQQRLEELSARLASLSAAEGESLPSTWEDLFQWTDTRFADRLVLTEKARRAARGSVFADIGFASEVIALLAGPYWDMRLGDELARELFLEESRRLRVEVSGVGDALNVGRLAGQYRVPWKGRTYTLDMHASGSSSRDRQRGFRLYFAWDDERRIIVVGSFPEHLTNAHS